MLGHIALETPVGTGFRRELALHGCWGLWDARKVHLHYNAATARGGYIISASVVCGVHTRQGTLEVMQSGLTLDNGGVLGNGSGRHFDSFGWLVIVLDWLRRGRMLDEDRYRGFYNLMFALACQQVAWILLYTTV